MCDPVTLTIAATAVSAAGTLYSGNAARNEALYSAGVARNNATQARNNAADAESRGRDEQVRRGQAVAQARSAQTAAAAANGLDTTFGSAADVVADTTKGGLIDQGIIRENAAREATGFEIQAQNYDEQGKAYKRQARDIAVSTVLKTAGTVLGGASQIKGMQPVSSGASVGTSPSVGAASAFGGGGVF